MRATRLILFPLAAAVACGADAAAAHAKTVRCGDTITKDTKLTRDLRNCPGAGIVIGRDGVELDLDGHTIDGVSPAAGCDAQPVGGAGVDNSAGHDRVTIRNGTITGFDQGVTTGTATAAMRRGRLQDLRVRANREGIVVGGTQRGAAPLSAGNVIEGNTASGNGCRGILVNGALRSRIAGNVTRGNDTGLVVCCSARNTISGNTVAANQRSGMVIVFGRDSYNRVTGNSVRDNGAGGIVLTLQEGPQHNAIERNTVTGNGDTGIVLDNANANRIRANRVLGNLNGVTVIGDGNTVAGNTVERGEYGVAVKRGSGSVITGNTVSRTSKDGIRVAALDAGSLTTGTVVRDNAVTGARADGIAVATEGLGSVTATQVSGNESRRAADDGFDVRSAATTLAANVARNSGDLGIEAIAGVADGGRNRAFASGNALGCSNVLCRR